MAIKRSMYKSQGKHREGMDSLKIEKMIWALEMNTLKTTKLHWKDILIVMFFDGAVFCKQKWGLRSKLNAVKTIK